MSENIEYQAGPTYRVPRRGVMDGGTKRLAIIAGGLGAVLLAVVGAYSLSGHHGPARVPVIEADSRPMKVKPENPGGMQLAGSNDEILSGDTSPQAGKLAPPPEIPEPQALKAQVAPKPAPAPVAPKAAASAAIRSGETDEDAADAPAAPAAPAATAPSVPPSAATPPSVPKAASIATKPDPAGGGTLVQLAALETEDEAKTEWARLAKKMPDVLGGRTPSYTRTERDGKTWWRLRMGGFADAASAKTFCDKVKAKGGGCSVPAS